MNTNNKNPKPNNQKIGADKSDTTKHQYKEHDEVLTNDENYDVDTHKFKGEAHELDDNLNN